MKRPRVTFDPAWSRTMVQRLALSLQTRHSQTGRPVDAVAVLRLARGEQTKDVLPLPGLYQQRVAFNKKIEGMVNRRAARLAVGGLLSRRVRFTYDAAFFRSFGSRMMAKRIVVAVLGLLLLARPSAATVWSLKSQVVGQTTGSCTGGNIATTIDCGACSLIVIGTVANDGNVAPTTNHETPTLITTTQGIGSTGGIYYITNPTHDASYQINVSNANRCAGMAAMAFDPADTTAPLHNSARNFSPCLGTTCQATSAVGASGELVVSAIVYDWTETASIDSSFTKGTSNPFSSGVAYGLSLAWKETSGTEQPTWTVNNTIGGSDTLTAAFIAGGGGSPPPCRGTLSTLGVSICGVH